MARWYSDLCHHETACGSPLPDFGESHAFEDCNNFAGFKDRDIPHRLGHCDSLQPYEFDFEFRFSILQEHRDYFL